MQSFKLYVASCCWMFLVFPGQAARILGIFTFDSQSHFAFHEEMMKSLLAVGHHVTIFAPFAPLYSHENYTVINSRREENPNVTSLKRFTNPNVPWIVFMIQALDILERECHRFMSLEKVKTLQHFDVMFVEMMSMYQCVLPIAKKLEIPVIGTISIRSYVNVDVSIGNPRNPSVFPAELFYANVKMSFYERILNTFRETQIRIFRLIEQRKIKKFCDNLLPGHASHNLEISLVFANNHMSLQLRADVPNVINIGGIVVKSAKLNSLPKSMKKFIDEAEHGTVLFSLGSIASCDAEGLNLTALLKNTFAKIPQRVIWKFDGTIEGLSENILLTSWMPQKEILASKNVLAFISHGGLSSTYEAIYFGKPMIILPVFAEQPSNAGLLKSLETGLYLNILELTEENLLEAINEIINNTKYLKNMQQLSKRFKDEPQTPGEIVVFWTEYVLRHKGASLLRSVTADMPSYQYLLLDIIAFVFIIVVLTVSVAYFCIKVFFIHSTH